MKNSNNLLDLFNTVNDIFTVISKIKFPAKELSKASKLVIDNKKTILGASAIIATTATATTTINTKNTKEKVKNSFKEGVKKGEIETKKKFSNILLNQKIRDEFLLLMAKIGIHIAKIDGKLDDIEIDAINNFIGKINLEYPSTHEVIKNELNSIIKNEYNSNELIEESKIFLNKFYDNRQDYINFMEELILVVIKSDHVEHELEIEFYTNWKKEMKI